MLMEREAKDFWSPALIALSAVCALAIVIAFVLLVETTPLILLPIFAIALLALISSLAWLCYDIFRRRFRHAFSIVAGIATAASIFYCTPLIAAGKNTLAFYARLPQFEQQVERARIRQTKKGPLQIVVDYQDRSLFVTANSFYLVVYDETDGLGPYAETYWPYAGSPTGVIAVDRPSKMHHLSGHYYDFSVSY